MTNPPNLLFVFADQLRAQSCGYMGDPFARTPVLDRLARDGVNFRQAVSMHPVCGPFRASLFTGCYSSTTGYVINELSARTDLPTLAGSLNAHGYTSAYFGKWHLYASEPKDPSDPAAFHRNPANQFVPPGPDRLGFDGHWAAYNFNHNYTKGFYFRDTPERIPIHGYEPDVMTDLALDYLDRRDPQRPFNIFLSYGTPHQPWTWANAPADTRAAFESLDLPRPANVVPGHGRYWHAWFDEQWWADSVEPNLDEWIRIYNAMTANVDWNVGRLLAGLDRMGLAENTLVVFTSDHGEMFGAHGRVQKNIYYEESVRVPLLMRWPGHIPAGIESGACINTPDLMPTLLGLLETPSPGTVEGQDLSSSARGCPGPEPDAAFLQGMGPSVDWDDGWEWRALRDRRFTYALDRGGSVEHLFDHVADPLQVCDRATDPEFAAERNRLRGAMQRRMAELSDDFRPVTWYRDHWIRDGRVQCGARGNGAGA